MTIDREGPTIGEVERLTPFDLAEFEALYRSENPRLLRLVMLRGWARQHAEDSLVEAWAVAWRRANTPDPPRDLVPFVYRTAIILCQRNWVRNRGPVWEPLPPENEVASVPDPTGAVDDYLLLKQLLKAIGLPDRQLEAYVLREYCGFTYDHAAQAMGVGKETFRKHLRRARAKVAAFREREEEG